MLAHMHHRMGAVGVTQPEIKRQISMGRHQVRVVIDRTGIDLITPRRLNADKGQAKTQPGNHQATAAKHRVVLWLAPTFNHRLAIGLGKAVKHRLVLIQLKALMARAQVEAVEIVADTAQQGLNQRGAGIRELSIHRVAFALQGAQNIQRRSRGVQPNAVADTAIAGRVVCQDQGDTLLRVRHTGQLHPAPRQFSDEIHPFGVGSIANHIRLAALTAPSQILEADRPADDPPIQLRQGNVHGQVPRAQTLLAGLPAGLVVLGTNGLDHRDIAAKRAQMRSFRAGLSKPGGIENDPCADFIEQVLYHRQAARLLQAGDGNRQRIEPCRLQTLAEHIDKCRVGRLQMRAIEQ